MYDFSIAMQTAKEPQSCPLLTIPVELRAQIYSYLFFSPTWRDHRAKCSSACPTYASCDMECFVLNALDPEPSYPPVRISIDPEGVTYHRMRTETTKCYDSCRRFCWTKPSVPNRSAILQTCTQIYAEAADVLYSNTLFVVNVRGMPGERAHRQQSLRRCEGIRQPLEQATLLCHAQYLDLHIQLRRSGDLSSVGDLLQSLSSMLNARRKFMKTFLSVKKLRWSEEEGGDRNVTRQAWNHLLGSFDQFNAQGGEVVLLSQPSWLRPGKTCFKELNQAVDKRLCSYRWSVPQFDCKY